jgi:hypothetical protein
MAALWYDIVKLVNPSGLASDENGQASWVKTIALAGEKGFASGRHARRPIDYRAGFFKRGGRWWMKTLIAGD